MDVKGKLVIITGSASGLGKAFANKLLESGALVCISDVNEANGIVTVQEFSNKFGKEKVTFVKCNVLNKDDIAALYSEAEKYFGHSVDIFCNNAGINHLRGWRLCMDINIMSVMECTEYAIDKMDIRKGGKGGLIVNTASMAGIVSGDIPEAACYYASKHGVVALTRSLGTNVFLKDSGVRVQCICPSFVDTNILADASKDQLTFIKNKYGIMTPEFVAEGFLKLVTECDNGTALCMIDKVPPVVYSDMSPIWIFILSIGAIMFNKIFGTDLFLPKHQMIFMLSCFILAQLLLYFLISFIM